MEFLRSRSQRKPKQKGLLEIPLKRTSSTEESEKPKVITGPCYWGPTLYLKLGLCAGVKLMLKLSHQPTRIRQGLNSRTPKDPLLPIWCNRVSGGSDARDICCQLVRKCAPEDLNMILGYACHPRNTREAWFPTKSRASNKEYLAPTMIVNPQAKQKTRALTIFHSWWHLTPRLFFGHVDLLHRNLVYLHPRR